MKILLIEDDKMLGKATAKGLAFNYAVDWAQTAEDAKTYMLTSKYDMLVCDINLPGQSGLQLLEKIRKAKNSIPVLFLTARDAVAHKVEGLNAGADDYMVKPFDLEELLARCDALIRRAGGISQSVIVYKDIEYNSAKKTVIKNKVQILLSAKELAIFDVLIRNIGVIKSRSDIEESIYSWQDEIVESNTIEVHLSSLRKKIGKDFIKNIRGIGYIIPKDL
jgi:DNA-binding response OmpR family regulator